MNRSSDDQKVAIATRTLALLNQQADAVRAELTVLRQDLARVQRDLSGVPSAQLLEANEQLGFKADLRNYGIGAQILLDLGVHSIRVLTNNPRKLVGLEGYGLSLTDRVRLEAPSTDENAGYLETKRTKLGHLFAI